MWAIRLLLLAPWGALRGPLAMAQVGTLCSPMDITDWVITSESGVSPMYSGTIRHMFDPDTGTAFFKSGQKNPVFIVDMSVPVDMNTNSLVVTAGTWSKTRMAGVKIETSPDGVTYTEQFSFAANTRDNTNYGPKMMPDRATPVRYLRVSVANGRYPGGNAQGNKWGMRSVHFFDCGPDGWPKVSGPTPAPAPTTTTMPGPTTSLTTSTVTTTTKTTTTSTKTTTTRTSTTVTSTTRTSSTTSSTTRTSSTTSTTTRTTSTTSTTTSTTSTNTAPAVVGDMPNLVAFSQPYMNSFALEKVNDQKGRSQIFALFPKITMVTFDMVAGADKSVAVAGTEASVLIPSTVLDVLGLPAAKGVIAVFDPDLIKDIRGRHLANGIAIEGLYGVIAIELYNETGGVLEVNDTGSRPIEMTLPANITGSARPRECAYFDEEKGAWSVEGLNTSNTSAGLITCQTSHLSFFAAILRGFLNALLCSQFTLFSREGLSALSDKGWATQPTAIVYWMFLGTLGLMLVIAQLFDRSMPGWHDDVFLIPLHDSAEDDDPPADDEEPKSIPQRIVGCVCAPFVFCYSSSVCRDALDEVCSRWFAYFGEVRGLCESICENLACCKKSDDGAGPRDNAPARVLGAVAGELVAQSSRRQACATLAVSQEVLDFLLDDEDLNELLKKGSEDGVGAVADNPERGGSAGSVGSAENKAKFDRGCLAVAEFGERPSVAGPDVEAPMGHVKTTRGYTRKILLWRELHQAAVNEVNMHWHRHGWASLPVTIVRFFFVTNPLVMMFMNCYFYSRTLRVLFFIIEMCSVCMVACVFFDASGMATPKGSDLDCSESDEVGEIVGRLIVIGLVSWLFGSIPGIILESLHSRSFKKFPHQNCDEWKKQLNSWFLQDCALWVFAFCYCGFCIFFVCLFLANVLPEELPSWGTSNIISVLQDEMIVPLFIAALIPPFAAILLTGASACARRPMKALLEEARDKKNSEGNWSQELSTHPSASKDL